jgi:hypothetical protein
VSATRIDNDFALVESVVVLCMAATHLLSLPFEFADSAASVAADLIRDFDELENILLGFC